MGVSEGGSAGRDLGSQVQAFEPSDQASLDCAYRLGEAKTSLPLRAAGAGSLGLAWAGRMRAGPRRPRGAGRGPGLQEGWVASEGLFPPWEYPAGQQEGRELQFRKAGRAWGSRPLIPSGRALGGPRRV